MEERKNAYMNIDDMDKLAIACVNNVCIVHTLMREIADEGENAEHAREHIGDMIEKGAHACGMLFGIADAIKKGHFEKKVIKVDVNDDEDTGDHKPFKLEDYPEISSGVGGNPVPVRDKGMAPRGTTWERLTVWITSARNMWAWRPAQREAPCHRHFSAAASVQEWSRYGGLLLLPFAASQVRETANHALKFSCVPVPGGISRPFL